MSVRFAILGLLGEAPLHGYAVHAAFEERLGDFWELNYGQVYQVLTALERQGLVVASDERVGRRPARKVYARSPAGSAAFEAWLAGGSSRARPFRDDLFLRLVFAGEDSGPLVGRLLDAQRDAAAAERAELLSRRAGWELRPEDPFPDAVRRLFLEAAILRADARLRALELCRAALAARAARATGAEPRRAGASPSGARLAARSPRGAAPRSAGPSHAAPSAPRSSVAGNQSAPRSSVAGGQSAPRSSGAGGSSGERER